MEILQVDGVVLDLSAGAAVEVRCGDLELEDQNAARADQDGVGAGAKSDDAELERDMPTGRVAARSI